MSNDDSGLRALCPRIAEAPTGPCDRESTSKETDHDGLSRFGAAISAKQPLKLRDIPQRRQIKRIMSKGRLGTETNNIGPFMHLLRPLHLQDTLPEGQMLDTFVNQQRQLICEGWQPDLVLGRSDIDLDLLFVVAKIESHPTILNRCVTGVAVQHGSLGVPETCGLVVLVNGYLCVRLPAETRQPSAIIAELHDSG